MNHQSNNQYLTIKEITEKINKETETAHHSEGYFRTVIKQENYPRFKTQKSNLISYRIEDVEKLTELTKKRDRKKNIKYID